MKLEQLEHVKKLHENIIYLKTELSKILAKTKPQGKMVTPPHIDELKTEVSFHFITDTLPNGGMNPVTLKMPKAMAEDFLKKLEYHYEQELRVKEHEFERL